MMNFWTPTFESWGKGLEPVDMPWYVNYDFVETYTWNRHTNGFDFHWRDDFEHFNAKRWHKNDNTTFDANSTTFRASQVYIDSGNLVLKMEPYMLKELHEGQILKPVYVEPVHTEPTYEHIATKGQTTLKQDDHYDVLVAQARSHYIPEHYPHAEMVHYPYGSDIHHIQEETVLYPHEPYLHHPRLPYGYAFENE